MSTAPTGKNLTHTVLVVDDEIEILRLTEIILTGQGYDVILSKGAQNALTTFSRLEHKPDLVLSDVVMPGMSGPMLVDQLMAQSPRLRVLFMSGYDETQVVQRYVVEKGFSLIAKPFTPQELSAAVKLALSTAPERY